MSNKEPEWLTRTYQDTDLDELSRIYLEVRKSAFFWLDTSTFQRSDFEKDTEGEVIRVAVLDDKPIGFVSWWPPDNFIHHLYVDAAFANKGVGKALLTSCLLEIGRPATLKCLQKNRKAFTFYQAQGWKIVSAVDAAEGDYFLMTYPD
ncbi:GNAT family N-acetyltransferase [Spirosoma flavus]